MGKGLLLILMLLVIGVIALGFHQRWFTASKETDDKGTEIKVKIDREKVKMDMEAYQKKAENDGLRVLVERLWPRGVGKQKAQIDLWLKDLAPSTELRPWFGHDPAKWPQFRKRYWAELKDQGDVLALLNYVTQEKTVTFIYAASDEERNSAVALKELLERGEK